VRDKILHGGGGGGGGGTMGMKIYLSTNPEFDIDFMVDEYRSKETDRRRNGSTEALDLPRKRKMDDTVLLWEDPSISSSSLARSFILTSDPLHADRNDDDDSDRCRNGERPRSDRQLVLST